MFARLTGSLGLALALAGAGCDPDEPDTNDSSTTGTENPCATDERGDAYAVGLFKVGAVARVEFVDAMPAPPARGDNIWHVRVTDMDARPLEDVEFQVVPFMPDHGHGTPVEAFAEPVDGVPGEYMISDVNMFMAGLWEVDVDLVLADETTDTVQFKFCVDP